MGLFDFLKRWRSMKRQPTKEQIVALNRKNPVQMQSGGPYRGQPSESFRPIPVHKDEIELKYKVETTRPSTRGGKGPRQNPKVTAWCRLRDSYRAMQEKKLGPLQNLNFLRGRIRK